MKLRFFTLLIFALISFICLSKAQTAFASSYQLSGKITDSSGVGIDNATIQVNDANSDSTTTDSSGNYSLTVPQGTYNILVTPPSGSNYTSSIAPNRTISSDTTINFILVLTGENLSLSGHLYDRDGNPVGGQIVQLGSYTSTTDGNGYYSIQAPPGTYGIGIYPPDTAGGELPQEYSVGTSSANYSLTQSSVLDLTLPADKVVVHTQDAAGNPAEGIGITTSFGNTSISVGNGLTFGGNSGYQHTVTTDSSGNVTLWLFPSSNFTFNATPPDGSSYGAATLSNINVTNDTQVTITLPQTVTLSGHVFNRDGTPVPNQLIELGQYTGVTDSSGSYSISAPIGTYSLNMFPYQDGDSTSLKVPQEYSVGKSYSLTQNTTQDITLNTDKVIVHVQNAAGNAISGIGVTTSGGNTSIQVANNLTFGGNSSYQRSVTTDNSGNVTLWLFPSSNITFNATPPDGSSYGVQSLTNISVNGDTQETIVLPQTVNLSGHVYNRDGTPVSNQLIELGPYTGVTDGSGSYSISATTGTYSLIMFPYQDGDSTSLKVPQEYSIGKTSYSLTQNTVQDITLSAAKVVVHVQDNDGNPIDGVGITTTDGNTNFQAGNNLTFGGNSSYQRPVTTDANGDVTLWLFPSSNFSFNATPPSGSIYNSFTLRNIAITGDQNEIISLQFNHAAPATTANLTTQNSDGTYSDPTTVTLSATAASGYTVTNTYYKVDNGAQQTYSSPFTITGAGSHTITYWAVDNSGVQEAINTKTFTIAAFTLSGTIYNDDNQNGVQNTGETGYSGAIISLNTGQTATTDSNGNYSITNLPSGTYTETLTVPSGYTASTANPATIALSSNTTQNFGIFSKPVVGTITVTPSPAIKNATLAMSANFTDGDTTDTHTASWNWGDGSSAQNGTVTEPNGSTPGSVTGSHTYTALGTHTITLTVTDNEGLSSTSQLVIAVLPTGGITNANLMHANYSGANFQNANIGTLNGSNDSNLTNINFTGITSNNPNFSNSNLTGSNFTNADLSPANLSNSNLTNVNFTGANLQGANLSGTTRTGIIWSNTICPNGTNSNSDGGTCIGQGGGL